MPSPPPPSTGPCRVSSPSPFLEVELAGLWMAMIAVSWRRRRQSSRRLIFSGNILAGVVGHQHGRDDSDDSADRDIDRDRGCGMVGGVQPGCDQWRRSAGDDGSELIA